jgi:hypothetical protein
MWYVWRYPTSTGYLIHPFLKTRREQRREMVIVFNFLQAYASVFTFLHRYTSKSSKSSSFYFPMLSMQIALYCNLCVQSGAKKWE